MSAFPENDIPIYKSYLPCDLQTYQDLLGGAVEGLHFAEVHIDPEHPESNRDAFDRNRRRYRLREILNTLVTWTDFALPRLDKVYEYLQKREFGNASDVLYEIKIFDNLNPLTNVEMADALSPVDLEYVKEDTSNPAEPLEEFYTLQGYDGPGLDHHLLLELQGLLTGGTENTIRNGILQAEILFGLGSFREAASRYHSLTDAPGLTQDERKFMAIRGGFAHLAYADAEFRKSYSGGGNIDNAVNYYTDAKWLLTKTAVSPDNPFYKQITNHADMQLAKLNNGQNFLGFGANVVPLQRSDVLLTLARERLATADDAVDKYTGFLTQAYQKEDLNEELEYELNHADVQWQIAQEKRSNALTRQKQAGGQIAILTHKGDFFSHANLATFNKTTLQGMSAGAGIGGWWGMLAGAVAGSITAGIDWFAAKQELEHQKQIANWEQDIVNGEVLISNYEVNAAESRRMYVEEQKQTTQGRLLNADLCRALAETFRQIAEGSLAEAIYWAYLYERAVAFEVAKPDLRYILLDYGNQPADLFVRPSQLGDQIKLVTAEALPQSKFDTPEITISLATQYPLEFAEFQQTGVIDFAISQYFIDKKLPGAYLCRIDAVNLEIHGIVSPTGYTGELTHWGAFLLRDRASTLDPATQRLIPTDEQLTPLMNLVKQGGAAAAQVGGITVYCLEEDTVSLHPTPGQNGVSLVRRPEDAGKSLRPFESYGAPGVWTLTLRDIDWRRITDIYLKLSFLGPELDVVALQPKVKALVKAYEQELGQGKALDQWKGFSMKQYSQSMRDALEQLKSSGEAFIEMTDQDFPPGITDLGYKALIFQAIDADNQGVPNVTLEFSTSVWKPQTPEFPPPPWEIIQYQTGGTTFADGFSVDLDTFNVAVGEANLFSPKVYTFPLTDAPFSETRKWKITGDPSGLDKVDDIRLFFMYSYTEV